MRGSPVISSVIGFFGGLNVSIRRSTLTRETHYYLLELSVICPAARGMNETASDAGYKQLVDDLEFNNVVQFLTASF